jgi:hypothetical protein
MENQRFPKKHQKPLGTIFPPTGVVILGVLFVVKIQLNRSHHHRDLEIDKKRGSTLNRKDLKADIWLKKYVF